MVTRTLCIAICVAWTTVCEAQQAKRIGSEGIVIHNALGLAKWRSSSSVRNNAEPGDSFVLMTRIEPSENLTVGVYLHATPLQKQGDDYVAIGAESKVPASRLGREWGYQSTSLGSAGSWAMVENTTSSSIDTPVQIFVPYGIIGLAKGTYRFRYNIRVINQTTGTLLDSYFARHEFQGVVEDGYFQEIHSACAGAVPVMAFTLEGLEN